MDERVQQRLRELKERHPESFTQQGIAKDEIFLGFYVIDAAPFSVALMQKQGIKSARLGSKGITQPIQGWSGEKNVTLQVKWLPIFANAEEFILAELKAGSPVAG